MNYLRKALLLSALGLVSAMIPASFSVLASEPSVLRQDLISHLTIMKGIYQAEYAPGNKNLDDKTSEAIKTAESLPNLTLSDTRKILMSFIYSMKDYHVSISFQTSERATLPLIIKSSKNSGTGEQLKYFLEYIDRTELPADSFPFSVGDQIVRFSGSSIAQAIDQVQAETPPISPETDRELAELALTRRSGARGNQVPRGPIILEIIPKGQTKPIISKLNWKYTPEHSKDVRSVIASTGLSVVNVEIGFPFSLLHRRMDIDLAGIEKSYSSEDTPYDIGVRKSFVPALGNKVQETTDSNPFHAYVFELPNNLRGGYIRIPNFFPDNPDTSIAAYSKIIDDFERDTDVLVIDLINNPGGYVLYLYALASHLSAIPLETTEHQISVVQVDMMAATKGLETLATIKDEVSAINLLGTTQNGFPVSMELVECLKNYFQFIQNQYLDGHRLSEPYPLLGVRKINPSKVHYSKPILLLTNALDFSGADFFSSILQRNKRVSIFGAQTAGAGGFVNDVKYPNGLGIDTFRVTESVASCTDDRSKSMSGVLPETQYQMTPQDLTDNYSGYISAIRQKLTVMLRR